MENLSFIGNLFVFTDTTHGRRDRIQNCACGYNKTLVPAIQLSLDEKSMGRVWGIVYEKSTPVSSISIFFSVPAAIYVQFFCHKGELVYGGLDSFAEGHAGSVAGAGFDADKDGIGAGLDGLEGGCVLEA